MGLPPYMRIEHDFTYHPPILEQQPVFAAIREDAKQLAYTIVKETPECREQSLALNKLEEAVMWANAAVARHWDHYETLRVSHPSSQFPGEE